MANFWTKSKLFLKSTHLALKVFRKPNDIHTLLKLGDLLSESPAFEAFVRQAKDIPEVRTKIEERYAPGLPTLEILRSYPNGSLGRGLAHHLDSGKLSLYPFPLKPALSEGEYLRERQREIHDLIHTLLGCGIEIHEEAMVNAFILGRTSSPISVLIVAGALVRTLFKAPQELRTLLRSVFEGYRLGQAAHCPFAYDWENSLTKPIEKVRQDFALSI
jgi:ubiquinone biosynthesis protein COQ4